MASSEPAVVWVEPLPTAVIGVATSWAEFPAVWGPLLGQVWAFVRSNEHLLRLGGSSVMLYRDDRPTVEVGVLVAEAFPPSGPVVPSHLPGGRAVHAVHHGPYGDLGRTHDAVLDWCRHHGLSTTRQRWEIYGDHHDDPARLTTDVYWQLEA